MGSEMGGVKFMLDVRCNRYNGRGALIFCL